MAKATTAGYKRPPYDRPVSRRPYSPKDTPEARATFLEGLRQGLTTKDAAAKCKVPLSTVRSWRRADEEFAAAWDEAYDEGTDILEAEAQRRAVEGVSEPVFQGGECVGHKQVYSDTLMNILLQGRRPHKYRQKSQVELSGPDGGPLQATLSVELVDKKGGAK